MIVDQELSQSIKEISTEQISISKDGVVFSKDSWWVIFVLVVIVGFVAVKIAKIKYRK